MDEHLWRIAEPTFGSEIIVQEAELQYLAWRFVTNVVQAARDKQLQCFHMYVPKRNEDSFFSAFFNTPWIQPLQC